MASIEDTISKNTSMILLPSERIMEDDNIAAEREKNPLSCFPNIFTTLEYHLKSGK